MYLEKIKKIKIVSGKYACFPNSKHPYMILPFYKKSIFIEALTLVKNESIKFKIFKFIFKYFWVLVKNIQINFEIINIVSKENDDFNTILFPPFITNNKLTMIKFNKNKTFVRKIGFDKVNKKIELEYNIYKNNIKHLPKVINYINKEYETVLDIEYYSGHYPKVLSSRIKLFFHTLTKDKIFRVVEHPLYKKMIFELENYRKNDTFFHFVEYLKLCIENSNENIELTLMHGDFSLTNVLQNENDFLIFDWEHAEKEGMPIDIEYYYLRVLLDNKKNLKLGNTKEQLSMLYYLYFLYKNNIIFNLDMKYLSQQLERLKK